MKIVFSIEADTPEEFAAAIAVIGSNKFPSGGYIKSPFEAIANSNSVTADTAGEFKPSVIASETWNQIGRAATNAATEISETGNAETGKKKRRTKAEIEADEKAAALAANTVAADTTTETGTVENTAPIVNPPVIMEPSITQDSLRGLCFAVNKHSPEAKADVANLIKSMGVASFGEIPESKYQEFHDGVKGLYGKYNIDPTTA